VTDLVVLDSSALLCLVNAEPGADRVADALDAAAISAVNLAETVGKLRERGLTKEAARDVIEALTLDVRDFTEDLAYATAELRPVTRTLGLSLGDRACLALAEALGARALTADRDWKRLDIGVDIELIR
jgi:PIN domain nuclease of toxin-antitoxin system